MPGAVQGIGSTAFIEVKVDSRLGLFLCTRQCSTCQYQETEQNNSGSQTRRGWQDVHGSWLTGILELISKRRLRYQYTSDEQCNIFLSRHALFGMMRKNPSRVVAYLRACGFGENLFPLTNVLREKLTSP